MATQAIGTGQGSQSAARGRWEKMMDTSTDGILEFLEQNEKWWKQAAETCERTAVDLATGEKEAWQLLGAVYRERAEKHERIIERLRQNTNGEHIQAASGIEADGVHG
ncbi:MAG TPA: hypothetical protein VIH76_09665 [Candidatus Acidoferrales bacterium]